VIWPTRAAKRPWLTGKFEKARAETAHSRAEASKPYGPRRLTLRLFDSDAAAQIGRAQARLRKTRGELAEAAGELETARRETDRAAGRSKRFEPTPIKPARKPLEARCPRRPRRGNFARRSRY
jgi:hypothetical protein